MKQRRNATRRRSAAQWAILVRAWERSRGSAAAFAADHGVSPATLTWWRWRLATKGTGTALVPAEPLRLVEVCVASEEASGRANTGWELVTARGHALRVREGIDPRDLQTVLAALLSSGRAR